jgi:outer membrane beta-barrel protein
MTSVRRCVEAVAVGLVLALALSVVGTGTALAQDGEATALDQDLQDYWAENRDIQVIQHRLYEKVGRVELSIFAGIIPNNPFLDYYPIGLRVGYYLLESLAIQVDGSYIGETFRVEGELDQFLQENNVNVDLLDLQMWRAHFGVNWSPFYGKLAFLGLKLVHFDLNLHAGFGVVGIENISENRLTTENELEIEGSLGAGFNFYINDMFSVRLDYRQYLFQKAGGGVSNPSEISLGFSIFL